MQCSDCFLLQSNLVKDERIGLDVAEYNNKKSSPSGELRKLLHKIMRAQIPDRLPNWNATWPKARENCNRKKNRSHHSGLV